MSKIAKLTLLCLLFVYGTAAVAQIDTPQPSPAGSVYSKVGLTDVTVDYFRPGVKGRKIFGEGDSYLQPYGVLWRTGANSGTKVTSLCWNSDTTFPDPKLGISLTKHQCYSPPLLADRAWKDEWWERAFP